MKFCVLGNKAGGTPTLSRNHSATALLMEGETLLFDCGEGTQRRLLEAKISRSAINHICISHLHVDHVLGVLALLATFSSDKRKRPLLLVGPRGIKEFLSFTLQAMDVWVAYPLDVRELETGFSGRVVDTALYSIDAHMLEHRVDSFGYRVQEKVAANVSMERAAALGLHEGAAIGELKRVGRVELDNGTVVELADVLAPPKNARSFVYCGDTAFSPHAIALARNATVLLHEATFTSDIAHKAAEWGHATAADAARVACEAQVGKLFLTHISARYSTFEPLLAEARAIFPESYIAEELQRYAVE